MRSIYRLNMSGKPKSVECPECGEDFDPSTMAGWCTNPECGEYHWESESDSTESSGSQTTGGAAAGTESTAADTGSTTSPADESKDKVVCQSCGVSVPETNFCKECGASLSSDSQTSSQSGTDSQPSGSARSDTGSQPTGGAQADVGSQPTGGVQSDTTPQADSGEPDSDDTLETCPSCGEDVQNKWPSCPFCQEDLEQHRGSTDDNPPDTVVVEVKRDELRAGDGESIGADIRRAYVQAGGDKSEAQYISREHVRIEREGEQFFIVNTGRNGTKLNGEKLALDERQPISEGDTLDFAGVVDGMIRIE